MPNPAGARRRTVFLVAYLVVLAGACGWTALGGSMLLLIVVVLPPALALVRSRMTLSAGLALLLVMFTWMTLVVFVISRYTGAPPLTLVLLLAAVTGVLCAVGLSRAG